MIYEVVKVWFVEWGVDIEIVLVCLVMVFILMYCW